MILITKLKLKILKLIEWCINHHFQKKNTTFLHEISKSPLKCSHFRNFLLLLIRFARRVNSLPPLCQTSQHKPCCHVSRRVKSRRGWSRRNSRNFFVLSRVSPFFSVGGKKQIALIENVSIFALCVYLFCFYYIKLRARLKLNIISKRCNMLTSVLLSFNNRLLTL